VLGASYWATPCLADEPLRRPLPESLLTESTTDIDAAQAGELEIEANLAKTAARRGGAEATFTSLEIEWRILEELGARVEPSYARFVDTGGTSTQNSFGLAGALAVGVFHDEPLGLHVQGEIAARTSESAAARVFEPSETELPYSADVLAAVRRDRWTLRATVGAEAGGSFAHAPIHTDLALLTGVTSDEHFGFVGLDVRADWARQAPLVLAPEVVADLEPLGLPFRLGVALPLNVAAEPTSTSFGLFVRILAIIGGD
jgi:hypothetical protein